MKNSFFQLDLAPEAKIVSRFSNGWETKLVAEHNGERVRITWSDTEARFLFPQSTLRLRAKDTPVGFEIKASLDGERYQVKRSKREIVWALPEHDVFFKTRGGRVSQVVGSHGFLKLRRNTRAQRLTLESSSGITDALVNSKGVLETFDGPELGEHVYFVQGLAFQVGPVTLKIPLPSDPFFSALSPEHYFVVQKELIPLAKPVATPTVVKKKDPLQADPPTWNSPELKARTGKAGADPLHLEREKR